MIVYFIKTIVIKNEMYAKYDMVKAMLLKIIYTDY